MTIRSRVAPRLVAALVAGLAVLAAGCAPGTDGGIGAPPTTAPTVVPLPPPSVATTTPQDERVLTIRSDESGAVLPDTERTPGDVYEDVDTELLCSERYPGSVRDLSYSREIEAIAAYRIPYEQADFYEIDHLVPIGLGGTNAIENLWPVPLEEPIGLERKDELDARLRELVCSGTVVLATAQSAIAADWSAAYETMLDEDLRPAITTPNAPPTMPTGISVGALCDTEGAEATDDKGRVLVCTSTQTGDVIWLRRN